jgi:hypothetical protein
MQKTVLLTQPHTHGRIKYPVGSRLTMNAHDADWIVAHERGIEVPTNTTTTINNTIERKKAAPVPFCCGRWGKQ